MIIAFFNKLVALKYVGLFARSFFCFSCLAGVALF